MAFSDFFKIITPQYPCLLYRDCVDIIEHEPDAKVKKVTWCGADFHHMDHQMAKDMKGFFDMAKSPEVFRHDCDGIIWFEKDGRKYMFLTELKSNFDTSKLNEAKTQIVSSFLKTNMLLHLSTVYRLEDYTIKGFIVGYPPKPDFKVNLYKGSMLSDKKKEREYDLAKRLLILSKDHSIELKPSEIFCLRGLPLGDRGIFPKIELHFIEVPNGSKEITLNVDYFIV